MRAARRLVVRPGAAAAVRLNLGARRMLHTPLIKFRHGKVGGLARAPLTAAPSAQVPQGNYPDHELLGLPALSPTMTTGNVGKWNVKVGDEVCAGDVLCEIETDKATVDFELQDDGFVAALLCDAGTQDVPVGQGLAVIVPDAEDIAAFANYQAPPLGGSQSAAPVQDEASSAAPAAVVREQTPSAVPAAASPAAVYSGELPPLYYLTVECRVDRAIEVCQSITPAADEEVLSLDSMLLKASCAAMKAVPAANSAWLGAAATRMFHQVHVECRGSDGTNRVIADAGRLGLSALDTGTTPAAPTNALRDRLLARQIPDGAAVAPTFSVDFLGDIAFGRQRLGAGQSVSLTLSAPERKMVPGVDGEPEQALMVQATLSCDHRTVDGALGAMWLQHFSKAIQDPAVLLL